MAKTPFKLRSKGSSFKMMGSSPVKQRGEKEKEKSAQNAIGHGLYQHIKGKLSDLSTKVNKDLNSRGWSDKQWKEYAEHRKRLQQPGGYHAGEFQKGHEKKAKDWEKKNTKTKTITSTTPKIPIGGIIGMTLMPLSAGKGSSVIDPETGINKYTGEKRKNIFSN
jgi:hypothetical protein